MMRRLCFNGDCAAVENAIKHLTSQPLLTAGLEGACAGGHLDLVQLLVKRGATINSHSLQYAYTAQHTHVVEYLLECVSNSTETFALLGDAHIDGDAVLVDKILQKLKTPKILNSLLAWASSKWELLGLVQCVVKRGADNFEEAIHVASQKDCVDTVQYLVGYLPVNKKFEVIRSGFTAACREGSLNVIKFLYEQQSSINIRVIMPLVCKHEEAFNWIVSRERKERHAWNHFLGKYGKNVHPRFFYFILRQEKSKRDWTFWNTYDDDFISVLLSVGFNRRLMSPNTESFIRSHTDLFRSARYGPLQDQTKNHVLRLHRQLVNWRADYKMYRVASRFVCKDLAGLMTRFVGYYIPIY